MFLSLRVFGLLPSALLLFPQGFGRYVIRPSSYDWKVGYGGPNMEGKGRCDEVEIIDRAEHSRIRRLKESAHMVGYNDLLSRPSVEKNTIWESMIKKVRWKNLNMSIGKKSFIIVVILVKLEH